MRRALPLLLLLAVAAAAPKPARVPHATLTIRWFGQSCFLLVSPRGTRALMDPIPDSIGYTLPAPIPADVVTISHEHGDHTNVALATGTFTVLRGLSEDKKDWVKHDRRFGDIRVRSVGVYHDDQEGAQRGLNSVFVFETAGLKIVHLGDLGHLLTPEQLAKIGQADVVMVPTGGYFTIDAEQAHKVIGQLNPRYLIIPMHYRTDVLTIDVLATLEPFLKGEDPVTKNIEKVAGNTYSIDPANLPKQPKIIILDYK